MPAIEIEDRLPSAQLGVVGDDEDHVVGIMRAISVVSPRLKAAI
jgi:hypothetical protein